MYYNILNININLIKTGENITELRKRAGLSVRDLQEAFGFTSPQAIYKWQRGMCLPTIDNLVILAFLFKVSMEEIIVVEGDAWGMSA